MHWIPLEVFAVVVIVFMLLKKSGEISIQTALAHLKNGALVVDVRSRGEFNSGHLPKAVNIPLDEIETTLPCRVPDKNQTLLLHCLSGTRSGVAKVKLKGMGCPNVFNVGSYGRAERILKQWNGRANAAAQTKGGDVTQ
ncbi:MAG TPA: rhodanese-like domain-containing protein [Candidatus Sulfopaludibacter sp.]|nr:rhodanese-like domain-containing protein [Candidatus Sulfopaludibacter sp.]